MIVKPGELNWMLERPVPASYTKVLGVEYDCRGIAGSAYWYTWGALPGEAWIATAGCPTTCGVRVE
jgi:hypothetical protein